MAGCFWVRTRKSDGALVKTVMSSTVPHCAGNVPKSWENISVSWTTVLHGLIATKVFQICSSQIGQTPHSYTEHRSSCDPEGTLTQHKTRSILSHSHIAIFIFCIHNCLSSVTQFPFSSSFPNRYSRLLRASLILSNKLLALCLWGTGFVFMQPA